MKKEANKRKKRDNLGDNEKEQFRKQKNGKKVVSDNLDYEKKEHFKKRTTKAKKKNIMSMIMKKNS